MASTSRIKYATKVAITIGLGSLAHNTTRFSSKIINTGDLYVDAILYIQLVLAAGIPRNDKAFHVYVYASHDGTNYTDNATGADALITLRKPTNLVKLGSIHTPDSGGLTYKGVFPSVASRLGLIPPAWGIAIEDQSGVALAGSGHLVEYVGIHGGNV